MSSESTDQLRNLGEEEEDFDQLNNETFGELSNNHDDWEYEHERLAESEIINVDNLPYIKDAIDTDDEFQPFNFFKYPPPPILTPFSPFPPPPDLSKFTSSHNLEDEVELAMHQNDLALQLDRLVMENEEEEEKFNKASKHNNITSESSWFCKNVLETSDSFSFFSDSFNKKPQQSSLGELVSNTTPLPPSGIKPKMTLEELEAFLMSNDEKKIERKDKESTQSSWPPQQPPITSNPQKPPQMNVTKDPLQHIHEQFRAQRNFIQQQQQQMLIQFHQIQQQAVQVQQRLITNSRHHLNSTQLQQQIILRQQQQQLIKYQRYLQQCMQQLQHDHLVLQHQYRNVVQQKQVGVKQEDITKTQQATMSFPQYQQQNFQQQQMIMMRQQNPSLMPLPPHLQQTVLVLPHVQRPTQPYPQRSPDDPFYNGLMEQREKDWLVKIQLQIHTDNPLIDDYYYTCWSVKKLMKENKKLKKSAEKDRKEREKSDKSLDNIENGRTTDSDESENEDDDEDAGKVAQLLISTDNDVESRNYTPVQFEGSLGKLRAHSIHNPRKALDVHVSLNVDEAKKQDDKKLKEVLHKIEKGFDALLQADELHNKLSKVDLDMRDNLEIKRFELIEKLTTDLLDNNCHSLLQALNIRKGVVMLTRWMALLTKEEEQHLVVKNLMFKLHALIKKEWCYEVSKKLYKSTAVFLIKMNNMDNLITYCINITKPCKTRDLDKFVTALLNNKLSLSCIFLLIVCMENLLEKHPKSPLEKLVDYNKWKDFIELVGRCLSKLESPVTPFNSTSSESFKCHLGKFLKAPVLSNVCDMLQLTQKCS